MFKRDMKNINTYRMSSHNIENKPEEGEIVDDYDLIVSSDEEFSMRQRIRELEAENEEIEQIAVISRSYADKINQQRPSRTALVPTDVSSISSTEFVTPKKHRKRKGKERKRKHCRRQHHTEQNRLYGHHFRYDVQEIPLKTRLKRSYCKRRQKLLAKKHKKMYSDRLIHKEVHADCLSFESPESSESSSSTDADNYNNNRFASTRKENFNNESYITRETLRLAVARNTNDSKFPSRKYCLKEKLLRQEGEHSLYTALNERQSDGKQVELHDYSHEDDDVQVIENEPVIQTVDEDSTDSMEERELRLIALKSAVLKKHMARKRRIAEAAYSPTDFDEMLSSGILQQDKMDDAEIVDLETEESQTAFGTVSPEASPHLEMLDEQEESQQMVDCKPVDMDIATSDSEDATIDNWSRDIEFSIPKYSLESQNFGNKGEYGFYMQELNAPAPPPPGVDDYEDMPPALPFYHEVYRVENERMHLHSAELPERHHMEEDVKRVEPKDSSSKTERREEEIDEEEEALRALLLSKFQFPKNRRKSNGLNEGKKCQEAQNKIQLSEQTNGKQKPTEIILKEAVKRLKIHSKTEYSKETSIDFSNKSKCSTDDRTYEYDNNDSLKLFKKLRNRLNIYKNQSQSINADQIRSDENNFDPKKAEEIAADHNDIVESNNLGATNTIDISDITRRLQKIKENVLNSTYNLPPQDHPTDLNSVPNIPNTSQPSLSKSMEAAESIESSQSLPEIACHASKPLANNTVNIASVNSTELNTKLIQNKKVKADFDIATNQTTFKVTISNDAALKPEHNEIINPTNVVTFKENINSNNGSTNLESKINGNSTSTISLNNERLVKITGKTTQSFVDNNDQDIKFFKAAEPVIKGIKKSSTPPYSFLRTTKIVKPNKVINANYELNLRPNSQAIDVLPPQKVSNSETNNQLSNASDDTRLITSIEQIKQMCAVPPFIISVQNSSNESTEDESCRDCDFLYKPLQDYNDNASPLSLNLESPSRTPLRSNSPVENSLDGSTKHTDMEAFNIKSDITPICSKNVIDKSQPEQLAVGEEKIKKTPLAVRHLPAAAQSEYRRLIYRMKLLENKRKLSKIVEKSAEAKNDSNMLAKVSPNKENEKADSRNSMQKTSLVKEVLLRNINTSETQEASSKLQKSNMLRSYENLYVKFGAGILNNLDKSLKLVEEAKRAKIAKLKLENRLKELKAEMDALQAKHKEEQLKISHIYPNICSTNEVITSLKQKRLKVFNAALTLGKSLKGDVYRLNNDLKESITAKSKKLATEIKFVNSLKAQNIASMEDEANSNTMEDRTENEMKNIEDVNINCHRENTDIESQPSTAANNAMICANTIEEKKEEENNLSFPLRDEVGGNTEFQSLDYDNSKSDDDKLDTYRQHKEKELNNGDSEEECKENLSLPSYISPLEHLRNIDSNVDPNGVVCPYDLMGNCEDVTCKYVHLTPKAKT